MKILFQTLGCKLNFAESSSLGRALLAHGHSRAQKGEAADVCVVNTCSVTDVADGKGRQMIRRLHRTYPDAVLIVTGCYAQLRPEEVSAIEGVDYVVGANDKQRIEDIVRQLAAGGQRSAVSYVTDLAGAEGRLSEEGRAFHPACSSDDRTRCFLKIQDGCDYYCTYCTIPLARGKSRNAPVSDTVRRAQQAVDDGAQESILTGVNIGDFGRSTGETFISLLRALDAMRGDFRIRISSCEPNLLTDEIIDFVAESRHFAPHFHIPLQSGSDTVLQIMHRRYTTALFAERVERIKERMPDAFIGVDCMVGVRGETDECFIEYLKFIKSLPVSQLHVFPYSERKGTKMVESDLPRVSAHEKRRREKMLLQVSHDKLQAFYASQHGRHAVVLWEGTRERLTDGTAAMAGWTENYVRVSTTYDKQKVNTFEHIII